MIQSQTRLVNQLTACLKAYYPVALTLFSKLHQRSTLLFLQTYPTPEVAMAASAEQITEVLKKAKHPQAEQVAAKTYQKLHQPHLRADEITTRTKARLMQVLIKQLLLQQALSHLDRAFRNFFEGRAKYPTFKKRHGEQSATYVASAFKWDGKSLTLAKMDAPLDIHWSRPLPKGAKPSSLAVCKDTAGRYFVSILIEEDITFLPVVNKQVGLDLGLKSMVITSDGHTFGNPKFGNIDEKKLARAGRRLAKKQKGSKNRAKARLKVARIHARIRDRRRDYQQKLSTQLIRENQTVCVESLHVKNLVQNHCLAKAISDVGWSEFVRQLEYKAAWYGRTLVKIDKWYPSSKRCFDCGHLLDSLTLDVRSWTCPECGVVHDRDINAAKNILAAGLAVTACGESVRPGRVKARSGHSPRSRKPSQ